MRQGIFHPHLSHRAAAIARDEGIGQLAARGDEGLIHLLERLAQVRPHHAARGGIGPVIGGIGILKEHLVGDHRPRRDIFRYPHLIVDRHQIARHQPPRPRDGPIAAIGGRIPGRDALAGRQRPGDQRHPRDPRQGVQHLHLGWRGALIHRHDGIAQRIARAHLALVHRLVRAGEVRSDDERRDMVLIDRAQQKVRDHQRVGDERPHGRAPVDLHLHGDGDGIRGGDGPSPVHRAIAPVGQRIPGGRALGRPERGPQKAHRRRARQTVLQMHRGRG